MPYLFRSPYPQNFAAMKNVTALFVRTDSVYKQLGIDCYDIDRDARNFNGKNPVIAHPPCRAWGQLRAFAKPRPGEKELAFLAIDLVRKNGGVLEHPRASKLFPQYLPLPGCLDQYGGYTICIDQFWFGHKARKNTLLYIVGVSQKELPEVPIRFDRIEYVVASSLKNRKEITKKEREATPFEFAKWLINVASKCQVINE